MPKDAHFESQALCIRKKILRALFIFPKLNESKRGLNRQVLAAESLIFILRVSDVAFYIHVILATSFGSDRPL